MIVEDYPLSRISYNIEEENYKLAKLVMKQAIIADCELSYLYAFVLKAQIEACWFSRVPTDVVS